MRYYIDEHPKGWIVKKRWFIFSKTIFIGSDINMAIHFIRQEKHDI